MKEQKLAEKLQELHRILRALGRVLVAYSGGVDSALLLSVACEELGDDAIAVTARSPLHGADELAQACELARTLKVKHIVVDTEELSVAEIRDNPPDRCYHCKKRRFQRMLELAAELGMPYVCDGSNVDDAGQHRPGLQACHELGIQSPLAAAGLTKNEIRELSRQAGLPTWNKPAMTCLATRFPYHAALTADGLRRVEQAEAFIWGLGVRQLRVRVDGATARIEVAPDEFSCITDHAEAIDRHLATCGFQQVVLDLKGYRFGSRDEPEAD